MATEAQRPHDPVQCFYGWFDGIVHNYALDPIEFHLFAMSTFPVESKPPFSSLAFAVFLFSFFFTFESGEFFLFLPHSWQRKGKGIRFFYLF